MDVAVVGLLGVIVGVLLQSRHNSRQDLITQRRNLYTSLMRTINERDTALVRLRVDEDQLQPFIEHFGTNQPTDEMIEALDPHNRRAWDNLIDSSSHEHSVASEKLDDMIKAGHELTLIAPEDTSAIGRAYIVSRNGTEARDILLDAFLAHAQRDLAAGWWQRRKLAWHAKHRHDPEGLVHLIEAMMDEPVERHSLVPEEAVLFRKDLLDRELGD